MAQEEQAGQEGTATAESVDYVALAQFRYQVRKFLAFSEAAAARAGLPPQQHQALLAIKGLGKEGGLSVGALAESLFIRNNSAVELVDRLQRSGLAERILDPADRRKAVVVLTPEGERRLAELSLSHLEELRSLRPRLVEMLERFAERQ